jgi:hypothetical protein
MDEPAKSSEHAGGQPRSGGNVPTRHNWMPDSAAASSAAIEPGGGVSRNQRFVRRQITYVTAPSGIWIPNVRTRKIKMAGCEIELAWMIFKD